MRLEPLSVQSVLLKPSVYFLLSLGVAVHDPQHRQFIRIAYLKVTESFGRVIFRDADLDASGPFTLDEIYHSSPTFCRRVGVVHYCTAGVL